MHSGITRIQYATEDVAAILVQVSNNKTSSNNRHVTWPIIQSIAEEAATILASASAPTPR